MGDDTGRRPVDSSAAGLLRGGEEVVMTAIEEMSVRWPGASFSSTAQPFSAHLLRLWFAGIGVETSSGSPYICDRDQGSIERFPQGTVALDTVLTGSLWRQQLGARYIQGEGEVCLTVVDEPFSYGWIRPGRSVRTIAPLDALPVSARRSGALATGVLPSSPLVSSYVGFITGLLATAAPDASGFPQLENAIRDIHRAVVLEAAQPRRTQRPSLRVEVEQLVEERFTDPRLSPTIIARDLGVSVRAVHQAFNLDGRTLANEIRRRRVRAAAAALRFEVPAPSLSELAERFGFQGRDQMSRGFRAVLGASARAYRNAERSATPEQG